MEVCVGRDNKRFGCYPESSKCVIYFTGKAHEALSSCGGLHSPQRWMKLPISILEVRTLTPSSPEVELSITYPSPISPP